MKNVYYCSHNKEIINNKILIKPNAGLYYTLDNYVLCLLYSVSFDVDYYIQIVFVGKKLIIVERFKNAIKQAYSDKSVYIYTAKGPFFRHKKKENYYIKRKLMVNNVSYIKNIYDEITDKAKNNELDIIKYKQSTKKDIDILNKKFLEKILNMNSKTKINECSLFFPHIKKNTNHKILKGVEKYRNNDINNPHYLFHGSCSLVKGYINPNQAYCSTLSVENNECAVYSVADPKYTIPYLFKLKKGKFYNFKNRKHEYASHFKTDLYFGLENTIIKQGSISMNAVGYIYVFLSNNFFRNSSVQWISKEKCKPIDIVKISYKDVQENFIYVKECLIENLYKKIEKKRGFLEAEFNKIKKQWFDNLIDNHDRKHMERVCLLSVYIATLMNIDDNDIILLIKVALYHDIGRINEFREEKHGIRGAKLLHSILTNYLPEPVGNININEIQFLVSSHCVNENKYSSFFRKYKCSKIRHDSLLILLKILKTADILDMCRYKKFNSIFKILNFSEIESARLIYIAEDLYKYYNNYISDRKEYFKNQK